MSTPRASIVRGPAIVKFGGQVFYTKQDFTITPQLSLGAVNTSMFGTVTRSIEDFMWQLSWVPDGQLIANHIAVLWPYAASYPGTSMFGASDSDVVIHTKAGRTITFAAGAVTAMPNLFFGPTETAIGAVTMMCVGKNDTEYNAAAKWAVDAALAFTDTSFNPANIKKMRYTGTWGAAAPWVGFEVEGGFSVTFQTSSTPDKVGGVTNDMILDDIDCTVAALPVAITEAQILAALALTDAKFLPGSSIDTLTNNKDLVITGGASAPTFTLKKCSVANTGMTFGRAKRIGETTWQSTRSITTGALDALFTLAWA
jgi:hypothetical protein